MRPTTKFAKLGNDRVGYQVLGDGPIDLVFLIAAPGEILVTSTVKDLVAGSGVEFRDRGVHDLKGVPGAWRLFAVEGTRSEARREGWPREEQR